MGQRLWADAGEYDLRRKAFFPRIARRIDNTATTNQPSHMETMSIWNSQQTQLGLLSENFCSQITVSDNRFLRSHFATLENNIGNHKMWSPIKTRWSSGETLCSYRTGSWFTLFKIAISLSRYVSDHGSFFFLCVKVHDLFGGTSGLSLRAQPRPTVCCIYGRVSYPLAGIEGRTKQVADSAFGLGYWLVKDKIIKELISKPVGW